MPVPGETVVIRWSVKLVLSQHCCSESELLLKNRKREADLKNLSTLYFSAPIGPGLGKTLSFYSAKTVRPYLVHDQIN